MNIEIECSAARSKMMTLIALSKRAGRTKDIAKFASSFVAFHKDEIIDCIEDKPTSTKMNLMNEFSDGIIDILWKLHTA